MTLYLLSIHQPQGELPPEPEFLAGVMRQLGELRAELASTDSWVFGQGLHGPETATVLRARDGDVLVTDGPFVEGKEYLGGITIIDVPDLDAALDWGRRYALATTLPIEVRPFQGGAGD
ncbi:YciI family protein [Micromonospora sp. NPDC048842]|uniref:YciI family protein n=1 Tax=unclassified Micromonospora TaxID=2617518 RepID=UPI0033F9A530